MSIFNDANFFRICGHIICLSLALLGLILLLFLARFGTSSRWLWISTFCGTLVNRLKLFRWSHTHDFVMTAAMILLYGFFAQMNDYHTKSTIQTLAIVLSYACTVLLSAYFLFMGRKLHKIVKLSTQDARQFCDRNYLFRDNLMSVTECAVHPKELYLNYLRWCRIVIFGSVLGAFTVSPMLCTATITVTLGISSLVYLITKPYPDHLQNILLGLADICTMFGLLFLSLIHFVTASADSFGQQYLFAKWILGWCSIIFFILAVFLVLIELTVSIVRGNSAPQKLTAEDKP